MADRIVVLRAGKVEQLDTPLNLFNRPANLFVAGFIGAPGMNLWAGQARDGAVHLASGARLPLPSGAAVPDGEVTIGVRPQHLRTEAGGPLRAEVRLVEALGPESVVHADLGGGSAVLAVLPGQPDLARGSVIELGYDPAVAHLFGADGQRLN